MSPPVLRVEGVSKRYGEVRALSDVSLDFNKGEVHAVLGENGAGKSTLMGVIAGFVVPDSGRVLLEGTPLPPGRPHETKGAGIEMVHQHFMLVQEFTVAENLALAQLSSLRGTLQATAVPIGALATAAGLGWYLDPRAKIRELPVGAQQRIEILKALSGYAEVLILDEPTAVLSAEETEELFRVLRLLRDDGKCVILIAHKLSEILAVADRVSVLRDGALVASKARADVEEATLAKWMVGEMPEPRSPLAPSLSEPLLSVVNLQALGSRGEVAVRGVSFQVSPGEILGIGGVDGNGQVELAESLAGVRKLLAGSIEWRKTEGSIGYIPQDRQGQGLALGMSVTDNVLIACHNRPELSVGPFLRMRAVREHARRLVGEYDVRLNDIDDAAASLSGGNQQKLVVSRVLDARPDLVVASSPTRGLDVRAAAFVQHKLLQAAKEGAAVVLFSTDLDELAALATRTLFMSRGRLLEGGAEAVVGGGA
ncbi:MAG: ABC transporter ATP-binding protein [Armatimonadetes bacterium]|nr:ABC transporter ATP-binding protein [Armatimonadota bacterium]